MKANILNPQSDKIIVNCSIRAMYASRFVKLKSALEKYCPDAALLLYSDYPDGCPTQYESQYAFKIHAIREAVNAGYRFILWMDCAFIPRAPISRLWDWIHDHGWYVSRQGDSVLGHWISDSALEFCGVNRETALSIPLAFSGLVGLDMENETARSIWSEWQRHYEAGVFNGPHLNVPGAPVEAWGHKLQGHASSDPSVQGHRHDEASLSFLLWQRQLTPVFAGFTTFERQDAIIGHQIV